MSFKLKKFNQSQVNVIKALINNQRNLMTDINSYVWVEQVLL